MGRTIQPDFAFLSQKAGLENQLQLKEAMMGHCSHVNMAEMAEDAAPFLFKSSDKERIIHFPALLKQYWP